MRLRRPSSTVEADLRAEVESGPAFMYEWRFGDLTPPLIGPELPSVHRTRAAMIEPHVRAALSCGGRALDLACHEGWFAHRLLEWGADEVVAIDIREVNVRRARLIRDHYGIADKRLRIEQRDVYDVSPAAFGTFDVVLNLGLIYHLENPIGALRTTRAMTDGVCLVETQLTQQAEPIRTGWGIVDEFGLEPASWAARFEAPDEQEHQPLAAYGGVISLIPNDAAIQQAMQVAGFAVERLRPEADANPQYLAGDRGVYLGR